MGSPARQGAEERGRRAGPSAWDDGSRAPNRRRQPTWSAELSQAVLELPEQYGWGKDKLVILLRRETGVDIIALLAIAGALALQGDLAGAVISVMLASGWTLEGYAQARAP